MGNKRNRSDIESEHEKIKKMIDDGAKALGRAKNLDTMIEVLLDIRDEAIEINAKLTEIIEKL